MCLRATFLSDSGGKPPRLVGRLSRSGTMPDDDDDDAKKKGKGKKGGSKDKGKGKKGGSKDKGKGKKKGSKDKGKDKKGGKSPKGKKGKSPKKEKESEGEASATEEGSGGGSEGGSPKAAEAAAPAAGAAPGAAAAPGAVARARSFYSEPQSMYDEGFDDDFYVDITCYPPRRGGAPPMGGYYGGSPMDMCYDRPPPRPMQMPMGMSPSMWGQQPSSMMGMSIQNVSQQMGPQTTTLTPGSPPMAFKTPSTTVIVNMSGERINRGGSRPMSPVGGPMIGGRGAMGGMGFMGGMGSMAGMGMGMQGMPGAPAVPGNKSPIVMSQPITNTGLTPQMQQLLLRGMPGYTATVVLILVPNP
ncbi:collagen alpha-1(I) chain-like [Ixodes scapularis]|uniref:collagen alpha-1(I) chain-like n=1 Tax=Ixodes scapularis TaxID=6945 RepID=UPI001A9E9DDF|nr:collagen alpha-1(I) chain-like [Ixodes scapularis]